MIYLLIAITLSWQPSGSADGVNYPIPAVNVSGYKIHIGCNKIPDKVIDVKNVTTYPYPQEKAMECYRITAYDYAGNESALPSIDKALVRILGNKVF